MIVSLLVILGLRTDLTRILKSFALFRSTLKVLPVIGNGVLSVSLVQDSSPFFHANFTVGFQTLLAVKLTVKEATMITCSEDWAQVPDLCEEHKGYF